MLCIQRRKQDWKWCGSIRARTRPMVSWEGMPLGSARNVLSQSYLSLPYCSISTGPSAPQISAQIVSVTISIKRCSFVRSTRGSSSASKCSMMVDVGISNTVSIVPFLTNPVPFHHFTSLPTESRCDDPMGMADSFHGRNRTEIALTHQQDLYPSLADAPPKTPVQLLSAQPPFQCL